MAEVMTIIAAQITTLTTNAAVIITSAVGLGAIFFGAKLLWSKFKGMAK